MNYRLPLRSLIRLNIVISLLFPTLLIIILMAVHYEGQDILYRFFQCLLFTNLVGFGNISLFVWTLNMPKEANRYSRWASYIFSYTWAILAWLIVIYLYSFITGNHWEGERGETMAYLLAILAILLFNTIILLIQNLIIYQYRHAQNEIEKIQLKANISDSNNLLLRQQIQPHFLFNALTTVKSLYKQDAKLGEEYLINLSHFLRASVSNPREHLALIKDEIAFCLNYLKMQKIRFGSAIEYQISLSDSILHSGYLPYFSLQPLIENALKHNELTEEKPITIGIYEEEHCIVVCNNLQESQHKEASAGNGLYNLKERYRLLGKEDVKIIVDSTFFKVYLKIL